MSSERQIEVYADWVGLDGPTLVGALTVRPGRGEEIFSFEYADSWIKTGRWALLDPDLFLSGGAQYVPRGRPNFGLFLDSSPDRWGRTLMDRREAQRARAQGRSVRPLRESDYLLGVHDPQRMGALRFRVEDRFVDDDHDLAAPPMASLRELEEASLRLEERGVEEDPNYGRWLGMLITPGSSLGGARPKANVVDPEGQLWIAKFPAKSDTFDMGAWEMVTRVLATRAGVIAPEARKDSFGSAHHTYLSRRFDRAPDGGRIHFASAMPLLGRHERDGKGPSSYLELAEVLIQSGAKTTQDLQQLWRRIAFFVCVSNTDDHLRNHGFLLSDMGWELAPAYDMNPTPYGGGLSLNISESDNARDLELVSEVSEFFRVESPREVVAQVVDAVRTWREVASEHGLGRADQERMEPAFSVADGWNPG